jgi:phospholipase/carboxylesterase
MKQQPLETIEVETGRAPRFSIIWLHGLGADGHDFEPIVAELELPWAARFVFPHAPPRAITINGGMRMRAWFDILSLSRIAREDEAGIRSSAELIADLIDGEMARGFSAERIVLAGFSQGGALALHVGLREKRRLAGIMALSAFLPLASTLARERIPEHEGIPIFMAHGTADPVIELEYAQSSLAELEHLGYEPEFRTYAMGHGVAPEEVRDIARWLAGLAPDRG